MQKEFSQVERQVIRSWQIFLQKGKLFTGQPLHVLFQDTIKIRLLNNK
jgi:hypothetical protein